MRNLQILYSFALRAGKCTTFGPKVVHFPVMAVRNTKFANFAGRYFPHFTTFRGPTLHFY
jgi:hypothetical protein